jgi:sulfide:quinone oxidoreductase
MARALRVVIAGGGVGGVETLRALDALSGDRVELTLLDPHPGAGPAAAHRICDALDAVDPKARTITTAGRRVLPYDVLVLALGARADAAYDRGATFEPDHPEALAWTLHDVENGRASSVAVVVPPGRHWSLPAYQLALEVAAHARRAGRDDVRVTIVVPEPEPLAAFGPQASSAVREELRRGGVHLEAGSFAELPADDPGIVVLHPGARRLEADRVIALPRLSPRAIAGIGRDFLDVDDAGRVRGLPGVYAVGDCTSSPVRHGGLVVEQADAVASHIASMAGATVRAPMPAGV